MFSVILDASADFIFLRYRFLTIFEYIRLVNFKQFLAVPILFLVQNKIYFLSPGFLFQENNEKSLPKMNFLFK